MADDTAKPKRPTGAILDTIYNALDDHDAAVVAKVSGSAAGWGLFAAGLAAGIWGFGDNHIPSFWYKFSSFWSSGLTAALWGGACAAIGAGLGFIFGVPRSGPDTKKAPPTAPKPKDGNPAVVSKTGATVTATPPADPATPPSPPAAPQADKPEASPEVPGTEEAPVVKSNGSVKVNTNLEEISDWLTKIIVGVTLVELPGFLNRLGLAATLIAGSLGGASRLSFAYALMLYFSVVGFLGGYLLTRLFLQKAFQKAS